MTEAAPDQGQRLAAARTRLILDRPFLGALVLRLPLQAAPGCKTMATDARALRYNPAWVAELSASQLQFALAHEALHCALGHFARRGHRVKARWDLACDLAINPLLVAEGLVPPPEAIVLTPFAGMSAEEIYASLDDDTEQETLDEHPWDEGGEGGEGADGGGAGQGAQPQPSRPQSAAEREELARQWQRHLAGALQRAREAGKLAGPLARLAEAALAARVSWRALLAHYLSQTARDDYQWQRPSRRGGGQDGEAILPGLRSRSGDLAVAVDVSGSIGDADLAEFFGELDSLKAALSARVMLFACDAALAPGAPWTIEPWEPVRLPAVRGGGGTSFIPVFDWLAREGRRPDALIWFTDAEGEFPTLAPDYPVFWLVKGGRGAAGMPIPFGRRIALN